MESLSIHDEPEDSYSPFPRIESLSIPEISPEEKEDMRRMASWRDHLISRAKKRIERAAKEAIAAGREPDPDSYNPKITQYDWLLLPPSELGQYHMKDAGQVRP
ncbi:uncharacterized protein LOC113308988 [Papaver somniferum]|uniref:uncharacterized protein LOC113308988 n=1 Tax=Papaver somniferum TaxID=3469 RepID=UPI000E6F50E8|nr:uncharacterized protein LOC113308988 [Papaver somniferum]XP_026413207.1 uncharacterized protein LOC113308988 [Papaver somniferum]